MLSEVFIYPRVIEAVASTPLGPYVDAYAASLQGRGYQRSVIQIHVRALGHLSRWPPSSPNARGQSLSRDGLAYILEKHAATAGVRCPSLRRKRLSAHVLRHTTAIELLQAGVDS